MTCSPYELEARRLRDAYRGGGVPPLREELEPQDVTGANALQAINPRFWQDGGRNVVGRKVGMTAKAILAQLGVDQPDYGILFDDLQIPDGAVLLCSGALQPKAKVKVAIVLGRDVAEQEAKITTCLDVADHAVASIEIVAAASPIGRSHSRTSRPAMGQRHSLCWT